MGNYTFWPNVSLVIVTLMKKRRRFAFKSHILSDYVWGNALNVCHTLQQWSRVSARVCDLCLWVPWLGIISFFVTFQTVAVQSLLRYSEGKLDAGASAWIDHPNCLDRTSKLKVVINTLSTGTRVRMWRARTVLECWYKVWTTQRGKIPGRWDFDGHNNFTCICVEMLSAPK